MSTFNMAGLRPDQGPPLFVPLSFFFTATVAIAAAGAMVAAFGASNLGSLWSGPTVALVHMGTVGLLMLTMMGALYQMLPVVAGARVPLPRLAHLTLALMAVGTSSLVFAQATFDATAFLVAAALLTAGLCTFWFPAAWALWRAGAGTRVAGGIRLALLGLLAVALVGLHLSYARGRGGLPNAWVSWRFAHAHLGLLGWVGALISAVSWQVVPMFYLAKEVPQAAQRAITVALGVTLGALLSVYAFGLPQLAVAFAALPGAVAAWLVNPALIARTIWTRKRRRKDSSLLFWWLSLGSAPVCLGLGAATLVTAHPAVPILYGLVALWGWAGALVHGMLTRIVPFLVWFHRCAPLVGLAEVPSMKDLLPDRAVALGFWLHVASLALGVAAAASGVDLLWRAFGVALVATAGHLATRLVMSVVRAPQARKS